MSKEVSYLRGEPRHEADKQDMASESVKAMNQKITENNLFNAKAVGETNAETDAFKCSRCQQRKCTYYQMQTRSADEPMTVSLPYRYMMWLLIW
jgi:transcription elongation factor S-II